LPPIINAQGISKAFGANPLFQNVSFTVSEGDRIGLIGPNGSGKSTLLRILAGTEVPDDGEVAFRKRLRVSYVEQESKFESGATVRSVAENALENAKVHQTERGTRFAETLGRAGFEDLEARAAALSGGWQKRLAIVEALVQAPDILLLDEPTNHLDLAGIEWLEGLLEEATFASVIVSHDRYFLENVATDMAELSRVYPDGMLRVPAHGSNTIKMSVHSSTIGTTTVRLQLVTQDGSPLSWTAQPLSVEVTRFGRLVLIIIGGALGILVLTSAYRLRRKRLAGASSGGSAEETAEGGGTG